MSICINNSNKVMSYAPKSVVASYANLSSQYTNKVSQILQSYSVRTDKANKNLIALADKMDIVVYPKTDFSAYDKKSSTNPLDQLDLGIPEYFAVWVANEGVKQGVCTVMKHFDYISGSLLEDNTSTLHFESGEKMDFSDDWPKNVSVGRVREIIFYSVPTTEIPIRDKISVESVCLNLPTDYDLTFIKQFTRLKNLWIYAREMTSLSSPSIPYLEKLETYSYVLIKTKNLRELKINNITIDNEMAAFISQQTRLIVLDVYCIENSRIVQFPSTLRSLKWVPVLENDSQKQVEHLVANCERLTIREFKTNIILEKVDWLNARKIKKWELNGVERDFVDGKYKLTINYFEPNLPYLDVKAEEFQVLTNDETVLNLATKEVTKIILESELLGKAEKIPVLEGVTELIIEYEVTETQAKLLARIFPQFTEVEIKEKGTNRYYKDL